eukprot:CAMPEP_0175143998 /NCGR_PEP_ID=MMETSP0087-20121206/13836_1 /TAXON_ID=136419 /ORGANISM="Unknown Unknown, Strain D1" /LENGTH=81 /DNA_ID=CAMNT_0016428315 /DNA_START=260 /DNA_END=502 /DNA_ORIENTATION=-
MGLQLPWAKLLSGETVGEAGPPGTVLEQTAAHSKALEEHPAAQSELDPQATIQVGTSAVHLEAHPMPGVQSAAHFKALDGH